MIPSATMGGAKGWRIAGWAMIASVLAAPLLAMQVTPAVAWTGSDFLLMAMILGGAGVAIELVVRSTANRAYRAAVSVGLAGCVLLVLVNGAVGIIGGERADANLAFGAVLAVGLAGSIVTRLRAAGMRLVLTSMAAVQLLVPVAVYLLMPGASDAVMRPEVGAATLVLVAIWLASARLFRRAEA